MATTLLLFALVPAGAIAAEQPRELLTQAERLHREARYAEALAALEQAYALQPLPRLLLNLAILHEKLGHVTQARACYARYLKEETGPSAALRGRAEAGLARLRHPAGSPAPAPSPAAPSPALPHAATTMTATAVPRAVPLHRRWWFWTALGGAAVVLTGVTVSVVATRSDPPNTYRLEF